MHSSEGANNKRYDRNPTHRETAIEVQNSIALGERKARPSDADQVVLEFADLEERKRSRRRAADDENRIDEVDDGEDDESMVAIDKHLK